MGKTKVIFMATKKSAFVVLMLVLLASAIAIIWHFAKIHHYTASDVFWYGVIGGFLGCLFSIFLALAVFLAFKLTAK